jgi:hypothetical protein
MSLWLPTAVQWWTDHDWEVGSAVSFFPIHALAIAVDSAVNSASMPAEAFKALRFVYSMTFVVTAVTVIQQAREVHRLASSDTLYQLVAVSFLLLLYLAKSLMAVLTAKPVSS